MKIIQISTHSYVNAYDESFTKIFGLGEDNQIYKWSNGEWSLYK
jgi:hypothetical protein